MHVDLILIKLLATGKKVVGAEVFIRGFCALGSSDGFYHGTFMRATRAQN